MKVNLVRYSLGAELSFYSGILPALPAHENATIDVCSSFNPFTEVIH